MPEKHAPGRDPGVVLHQELGDPMLSRPEGHFRVLFRPHFVRDYRRMVSHLR
jgi:hypothetical protein